MIDQDPQPKDVEDQRPSLIRRIEPDWTESEWFQVWLQLARHPYHCNGPTLAGEIHSGTTTR